MSGSKVLLGVLAGVAACGTQPSGNGSMPGLGAVYVCDHGDPPTPCEELDLAGTQVDIASAACEAGGGTWHLGLCLSGASVGRCTRTRAGGGTQASVYYDRATVTERRAECERAGGLWGAY